MRAAETKRDLIAMLPRLRRFARSLVSDPAEADELVRQACLRAVARGPRAGAPLDRWMYRLLRGLASDARPETASFDPGDATAAELRDAVLGLPSGMTSAVILVAVEGYGYREAADILGVPASIVMRRMSRARCIVADMGLRELERMGAAAG